MFIGHYAVGFAAKRVAPRASLGVLMAAPLLLDLLWPYFLLLGWEEVRIDPGNTAFTPLDFVSYPITHSLVTSLGWAAIAAAAYWRFTRYRRGALVVAAGVVSHWLFDYFTHRPDLPLAPGLATRVGLGLWRSIPATIVVESALFLVGLTLYLSATRARDRVGGVSLWAFVATLAVLYVGAAQGTPPPSARAVAVLSAFAWIFPLWAWRFDRRRVPVATTRPSP